MGAMARLDYDELNATIRYVMFSAFAVQPGALGYDEEARAAVVDETATFLKRHEDTGVVVRGIYDVAGMRADADFMFWTHAERVESLQALYSDFRRTTMLGRATRPVWSSVALHRPAEFNKSHIPAFALGDYEWILAFEAPELHRIVDLMRDLRATEARRHVREEIPFFTGPRVGVEELVARLP